MEIQRVDLELAKEQVEKELLRSMIGLEMNTILLDHLGNRINELKQIDTHLKNNKKK